MLQRSDEPDSYYSIPYASSNRSEHRTYPHASQPTSPTPASRYNYQSPQPNHRSVVSSPYTASIMNKINTKDDDSMLFTTNTSQRIMFKFNTLKIIFSSWISIEFDINRIIISVQWNGG